MSFARESWELFKGNGGTAILFEVVYKLILVCLVLPLEVGLLNLALMAKGDAYLSDFNLAAFLAFPVTWLVAILMLLVLASYSLLEICGLIALAHASRHSQRLTLRQTFSLSTVRARQVASKGNRGAIVFVLLVIPLTNVTLTSNAVRDIHIPEFISDYIQANGMLNIAYVVAILLLCYLAFVMAFSLHCYMLEGATFRQGAKGSKALLKGHRWYFLWRLLLVAAFLYLVSVLVSVPLVLIFAIPLATFASQAHAMFLTRAVIVSLVDGLAACLTTPLLYDFLTVMYYRLLGMAQRPIPDALEIPVNTNHGIKRFVAVLAGTLVVAIGLVLATESASASLLGMMKVLSGGAESCSVTAHRGGSLTAPENTLQAFRYAIDNGADWVELDVQQTEDGVLVVMHDSNLKRTTGVDANIWDVTYDEIKDLDNGSYFGPGYSDVRICTLEQALYECKGRIRMNIEVKPDGHGTDLERKTVELIDACGMHDQVAIASIRYDSLVKVKECDPSMQTMYDMTLAYGRISEIPDVDIYSVDEACVTPTLVALAHLSGKQVFAWTVNDEDNMVKRRAYGADSLITDRVKEAEAICD